MMLAWILSLIVTYGGLLACLGYWCLKNKLKRKNDENA